MNASKKNCNNPSLLKECNDFVLFEATAYYVAVAFVAK